MVHTYFLIVKGLLSVRLYFLVEECLTVCSRFFSFFFFFFLFLFFSSKSPFQLENGTIKMKLSGFNYAGKV